MKTIRIDGVDYEVGTEAFAQALAKYQKKMDAALERASQEKADLVAECERLQAKHDEALESVAKLDAEVKALPAKIAEQTKARLALESKAREVMGKTAKLDADDLKLRAQVLRHLNPKVKLDGKSPEYIEARFDAAVEAWESEREDEEFDAVDAARESVENVDEENVDEEDATDTALKAYEKMRKDNAEAWKRTLKRGGIEA